MTISIHSYAVLDHVVLCYVMACTFCLDKLLTLHPMLSYIMLSVWLPVCIVFFLGLPVGS